jgi:hypothetical protein
MTEAKLVYHGSPEQDLGIIVPHVGTHQRSWVYATKDLVMASLFVRRLGGDRTCRISRDRKGTPCVEEVYSGALVERYGVGGGSIYLLSGKGFLEGQTTWRDDLVCENEAVIIEENKIDNALDYILSLEREKRMRVVWKNDGS